MENGTPIGGAEEWRKIRNVRARTIETEAAERQAEREGNGEKSVHGR